MVPREIGEQEHNCPETEEWRRIREVVEGKKESIYFTYNTGHPSFARELKISVLREVIAELGLEDRLGGGECGCPKGILMASIKGRLWPLTENPALLIQGERRVNRKIDTIYFETEQRLRLNPEVPKEL